MFCSGTLLLYKFFRKHFLEPAPAYIKGGSSSLLALVSAVSNQSDFETRGRSPGKVIKFPTERAADGAGSFEVAALAADPSPVFCLEHLTLTILLFWSNQYRLILKRSFVNPQNFFLHSKESLYILKHFKEQVMCFSSTISLAWCSDPLDIDPKSLKARRKWINSSVLLARSNPSHRVWQHFSVLL